MRADTVLRWVEDSYIQGAVPSVVIEDDGERVVLFQPSGSDHATASGRRGGPRGRNMEPGGWDGSHLLRTWTGDGVVRAHHSGEPWSTWRWLNAETQTWSTYCYVNLEDPWRRSAVGFDTRDWILDLVIRDDGEVIRKDDDELAWALEVGRIDEVTRSRTEQAAESALAARASAMWPFAMDWTTWTAACSAVALLLPANWADNPTRNSDQAPI